MHDLTYVLAMPELCDVVFLVGKERSPVHYCICTSAICCFENRYSFLSSVRVHISVYGVRAVLAIRSRAFYKLFHGPRVQMQRELRAGGVLSPSS